MAHRITAACRYTETFIADVKAKTDLVALVGRDVALKRSGGDQWGLCPFHSEKTPSFKVDPKHGFFHCFGCGAHGDAVDYLMQTQGVDFSAADKTVIAQELDGRVTVAKINIDENPLTPQKYGVRGIPTLMLFKDGQVAATKVGALPKNQLASWVESVL